MKTTSALNHSFNQYLSYPAFNSLEPLFKEITMIISSANSMSPLNLNFQLMSSLFTLKLAHFHLFNVPPKLLILS